MNLLNASKWAEFWTEKQLYVVLFRSWFYFHNNLVIIIGYMVLPFLQEKYPKYIHNIFVLFFLQKILQKRFFFVFSKDKLSKNATYYFTYTTHKSKITSFVYFFFIIFCYSFLGNGVFSQTCCLFLFFTGFVCRWMKIVVVVIFKHVQTCLLPWLILRKMHYKIWWTLEEVKTL